MFLVTGLRNLRHGVAGMRALLGMRRMILVPAVSVVVGMCAMHIH